MPKFSAHSLGQLATCDVRLQRLFKEVIKHVDCRVLEGHRSLERQAELLQQGATKVTRGKHNEYPSLAIDVAPYPVDWNDRERFILFAGFVKGIASQLGIPIRWGGDWDRDGYTSDETFSDLVHFELGE